MGDMGGPGTISPGPMSGHGPGRRDIRPSTKILNLNKHKIIVEISRWSSSRLSPWRRRWWSTKWYGRHCSHGPFFSSSYGTVKSTSLRNTKVTLTFPNPLTKPPPPSSPAPSPGFPGPSPRPHSFGGPSPHPSSGGPQGLPGPPTPTQHSFGGPSPAQNSGFGGPSPAHPGGFGGPSPAHMPSQTPPSSHSSADKLYPPNLTMVTNPQVMRSLVIFSGGHLATFAESISSSNIPVWDLPQRGRRERSGKIFDGRIVL